MKRLEGMMVYRYTKNGLHCCGDCATDRSYPENFELFTARMEGKLAGCEYCGATDKLYATSIEGRTIESYITSQE